MESGNYPEMNRYWSRSDVGDFIGGRGKETAGPFPVAFGCCLAPNRHGRPAC